MIAWTTPAPLYRGRHRAPTLVRPVDESRIPDDFAADFMRHLWDKLPCLRTPPAPRDVPEAMELADMDADGRLTAWMAAQS